MIPTDDLYEFGSFDGSESVAAILMIVYLIYMLVVFGIGIAQYVLQSVGLYSISKRRDIRHPWLSWLPIGNLWILGCISDQYRYVTKGKTRSKRKWLVALSFLSGALVAVGVTSYFISVFKLMMESGMWGPSPEQMMSVVLRYVGVLLAVLGISVILAVIQYMALYDLYVSCEPRNGALFLVLSIFVNITMPLLVFLSRKKDLGMPPRKTQHPQEEQNSVEDN